MTSILTNLSAMSALATLTATQKSLATTQTQVSTGLKVSSAADDPSYWGIATLMRSRIGEVQTINDSLNITNSLLNVTSVALTNILTAMNAIKNDVVQAQSSGVSWDTLQQDIARQQQQITTYATNANFDGQNLLDRNWVETATEDKTLNYDGTNLLGGSGTEKYLYDDGQGTKYEFQDDFTIDPSGAQTYIRSTPITPSQSFQEPIKAQNEVSLARIGRVSELTAKTALQGVTIARDFTIGPARICAGGAQK